MHGNSTEEDCCTAVLPRKKAACTALQLRKTAPQFHCKRLHRSSTEKDCTAVPLRETSRTALPPRKTARAALPLRKTTLMALLLRKTARTALPLGKTARAALPLRKTARTALPLHPGVRSWQSDFYCLNSLVVRGPPPYVGSEGSPWW